MTAAEVRGRGLALMKQGQLLVEAGDALADGDEATYREKIGQSLRIAAAVVDALTPDEMQKIAAIFADASSR